MRILLASSIVVALCLGSLSPRAQAQTHSTVPGGQQSFTPAPVADPGPTLPGDSLTLQPIPLAVGPSPSTPSIRWDRFIPVSTLMAGAYTGAYIVERQKWWVGQVPFHFDSHLDYAQNMDKLGHFYVSQMQALANTRILEWTGVRSSRAALAAGVLTLAAQTNVEIHDGYNARWGFDVYDGVANVLGVSWFFAHERISALRRFDFRLGYWNPELPPINQSRPTTLFTDDYMGMTFWLSMRVYDLLPETVRPYWPRFLKLSGGISLNDWQDHPDPDAYLSTHVSVDIDWREIIPRDSWIGRTGGDILNRYHLPAPAIQITPRPGFSLIFLGQ